MDASNMGFADLVAATKGNDGWGGMGFLIVLILFFALSGNGILGGGNALTQTDALMNAQFGNLDSNVQAIANRQYEQANNLTKGICELGTTMMTGMDGINANIANNMYQTAQNINAATAATNAKIDELSNRLYEQQINALTAEVNELKFANNQYMQNQTLLGAMGQWRAFPPCPPYYGCACQ